MSTDPLGPVQRRVPRVEVTRAPAYGIYEGAGGAERLVEFTLERRYGFDVLFGFRWYAQATVGSASGFAYTRAGAVKRMRRDLRRRERSRRSRERGTTNA